MTADFKLIKQKIVHKWAAWSLVQADFSDPVGEKFVRTYVDSPGAVGVVALVGDVGARRVLLVRQYRPPLDNANSTRRIYIGANELFTYRIREVGLHQRPGSPFMDDFLFD